MGEDTRESLDLDASVNSAIQETERYYREQIFSSGCSSIVPIYRINDHTNSPDALMKQLQGSPYIQKEVKFSEKVIETLLDIKLYCYQNLHFFFQGDMAPDVLKFVETNCVQVDSLAGVIQQNSSEAPPKWGNVESNIDQLLTKYPILSSLECENIITQINSLITKIKFDQNVESYLEIFYQPEWKHKFQINQSTLICMIATANAMAMKESELRDLIALALLKDVGYARLNEGMDNFEVMHPLVTHKILSDCNQQIHDDNLKISKILLDASLVHHEFVDSSGPLSRMRHPLVVNILEHGMPAIAQISGICDLYFGFLDKYSPSMSFAITCGFVLGQGNVVPRYDIDVIQGFTQALKSGSYSDMHTNKPEADATISAILGVLKEPGIQKKAIAMINMKSESVYERITLALNIVRNIAKTQPNKIHEDALVKILHLPVEFGLNY